MVDKKQTELDSDDPLAKTTEPGETAENLSSPDDASAESLETTADDVVADGDAAVADDGAIEEAASEPEPEKIVERVVEKRRGSFIPALLGGAIAAAFGYVAGQGGMLESVLPANLRQADLRPELAQNAIAIEALQSDFAALRAAQSATNDAISGIDLATLSTQVADIAAAVTPIGDDVAQNRSSIAVVTGETGDLSTQLIALADRVDALEKRPISEGVSEDAIAAYEAELTRLQETVAGQRAEYERMLTEAQALEADAVKAAKVAAAGTAMSQLTSALDSGSPYTGALETISAAGFDVPSALSADAESGVATLAALRTAFPDAARDALAAARSAGSDGPESVTQFLQRQLGMRSVVPREGDDPDAVLSRAEAALVNGNLTVALTEIAALPDAASAPLADWITQAQARQAALDAATALLATMNTD